MSFQDPTNINAQIDKGIAFLEHGGVVAFPTETVYCLAARYDSVSALERIYDIKQRPRSLALPVMVSNRKQINEVVTHIPALALPFIEKYMPGAITLIMPRNNTVSDIITNGKETVAVRIPLHRMTIDLIEGAGAPLVGTSANTSGEPSNITASNVFSQIGDKVDLVIDDGKCPVGIVSTIIDVTGEVPVILREGAITRKELEEFYEGIK
ncbi:MAG: L-threonylcarbamoyladenylate synthase [Dehalococcoidales bacterium]|nr:L-threonylcarbamoyladenylate synthase [Dehalococcoidales bacterium]